MNKQQLLWCCRRGVRELDVLLTNFVDQAYNDLDNDGQQAFEELLTEQDPIIMDWLFNRTEPDDQQLKLLVNKLRICSGL